VFRGVREGPSTPKHADADDLCVDSISSQAGCRTRLFARNRRCTALIWAERARRAISVANLSTHPIVRRAAIVANASVCLARKSSRDRNS
jgi:hypothetical protein